MERANTLFPAPVIDPENYKGGTLRAPLGFSMATLRPPELAHQYINELGSMTLTIGSIFRGQANATATLLHDDNLSFLKNKAVGTRSLRGAAGICFASGKHLREGEKVHDKLRIS